MTSGQAAMVQTVLEVEAPRFDPAHLKEVCYKNARLRLGRHRIAAVCALSSGPKSPDPADLGLGWVSLFNGKDLTGWIVIGKERWVVEDVTVYGESVTKRGDGFLKIEKTYKDFDAFLRFKCESPANSGFFYHSYIEEDISTIRVRDSF